MKIIVLNDAILATHSDNQDVESLYPQGSISYILPEGYRKFTPIDKLSDNVDLQTAKNIHRKHLETQFAKVRSNGFTGSSGIKIQCEEADVTRLVNAKSMALMGGALTITVRDYNNTQHILPMADFDTLIGELGYYMAGLLHTLWIRKDAIDKADNVNDVFAIGL